MQATACLSGSHSVGRSAARSRFHGSSSPTVNNATGCVMPRRNYAKSSRPHFIFETKGKKNSPFKKISRRIKEGGDEMGDRPYFAPCHSGVITSIEQQNEISASSTFVSVSSARPPARPPLSFSFSSLVKLAYITLATFSAANTKHAGRSLVPSLLLPVGLPRRRRSICHFRATQEEN